MFKGMSATVRQLMALIDSLHDIHRLINGLGPMAAAATGMGGGGGERPLTIGAIHNRLMPLVNRLLPLIH